MPFTLRLMYHSVRAVIRAGILLFLAWIVFVPATADEATALGADPDTQYPAGLRPMRTAQMIVAIAPDPAYDLMARVAGAEMRPWMIKLVMQQMAQGRVLPPSATVNEPPQTARDIDGPRFIQVD